MRELDRVEGAFLTSSLREIQPVSFLDGRALDSVDALAEIEALRRAYRRRIERFLDGTPSRR